MIDFPVKGGRLRVNPNCIACLWQPEGKETTAMVLSVDALTYDIEMSIDAIERRMREPQNAGKTGTHD